MAMTLPPVLRQRYFDTNGNPLAGGKLYTYQAGTTTPQATYTNQGGGTACANPIVLDANGEADMWLDPSLSYKFVLKDSSDVTQWTDDNVVGLLTADAVATASIQNSAVTTAKIADDAVTADKLKDSASVDGDRAVTTNHLRNSSVTNEKLAVSSINGQTAETALATGDEVLIYDTSATALRKMTVANFSKVPTVQKFTSGSGTYTTPSGVRWIRVKMAAAGGGGAGSGSSAGSAAGTGGSSTFGSSLLTASGGAGGTLNGPSGNGGSTVTVNAPAISTSSTAGGHGGNVGTPGGQMSAGHGGASAFGGGGFGGGGSNATAGATGLPYGSGGGGAGGGTGSGVYAGAGGGAGAYIEAIITGPSATYAYAVGAAGTAGGAGPSGLDGGSGAPGIIIVEEYYS